MSHYCHFTSPIRRYPDLVVHRIVENLIEGKPAKENTEILERLGEHCSATEQNAESAERELVRVKLLHFLEKRIGELLTGIVWGVKPNGLIVRGIEIPVDGIVSLDRLPPDRYRYNRDTHTLQGYRDENQFRLGDELVVRIERVDLARRQLEFRLEKVTHHDRPPSSPTSYRRPGADRSSDQGRKQTRDTKKSLRNKPSPGRKKKRR
jgi:ribonuclease R